MGVTAGVLRLLKYGSRPQLEALAKLCVRDEGIDDAAVVLEARRRIQEILETQRRFMTFCEVQQEVLDGVLALGKAEIGMKTGQSKACF